MEWFWAQESVPWHRGAATSGGEHGDHQGVWCAVSQVYIWSPPSCHTSCLITNKHCNQIIPFLVLFTFFRITGVCDQICDQLTISDNRSESEVMRSVSYLGVGQLGDARDITLDTYPPWALSAHKIAVIFKKYIYLQRNSHIKKEIGQK